MKKNQLKIILGITCAIIGLAGCSKKPTTNQQPTTTLVENPVVEEPETKVEEPEPTVEEPVTEEPTQVDTSNLTNEEWFNSLNLDSVAFFLINSDTKERRILKNGGHYYTSEGDEFVQSSANGWEYKNSDINSIIFHYDRIEEFSSTNLLYFQIIYDELKSREDTEISYIFDNKGKEVTFTFYISYGDSSNDYVEDGVEAENPVTEEPVAVDTSKLSDEEWVEYLNLDTYTFIVINTITGERRVLNDGEHYTLVKGDKFGDFLPEGWIFRDASAMRPYIVDYIDEIPLCTFYELDYSKIPDDYEWKGVVTDEACSNDVSATVYITVDPSLK